MPTHLLSARISVALGGLAAILLVVTPTVRAQKAISLELHANENVSASSIGLPHFPTSHASLDASNDSAADVGFTFGSVHFRVMASKFTTHASPDQVLDFYRAPLARYGEVIECEHGRPVGSRTSTKEGLTCSESHGSHVHGGSDSPHELRSGTREHFRVVAIESSDPVNTNFALLYLELPKDDDSH